MVCLDVYKDYSDKCEICNSKFNFIHSIENFRKGFFVKNRAKIAVLFIGTLGFSCLGITFLIDTIIQKKYIFKNVLIVGICVILVISLIFHFRELFAVIKKEVWNFYNNDVEEIYRDNESTQSISNINNVEENETEKLKRKSKVLYFQVINISLAAYLKRNTIKKIITYLIYIHI